MVSDSKHAEVVQTAAPISEYVRIESHVLSTCSADAYRGYDTAQKQNCCIWIGREPLQSKEGEMLRFLRRLEVVDEIDPPLCILDGYGVDSDGRPFALFSPLDGHKITDGNYEASEAERRFSSCLRLVSDLHEQHITCGDLSEESFWISRNGEVIIIGLMGMLGDNVSTIAQNAPTPVLPYIAPELFQEGARVSYASDVFSLGVLAYHFFSKSFPYDAESFRGGGQGRYTPIEDRDILRCPLWLPEVLSKCLSLDPAKRYKNAPEIIRAIGTIRTNFTQESSVPAVRGGASSSAGASGGTSSGVSSTALPVTQNPIQKGAVVNSTPKYPAVREEEPESEVSISQLLVLGLLVLTVGAAAAFFLIPSLSDKNGDSERLAGLQDELRPLIDVASDDPLADDIGGIANPSADLGEKRKFLKNMSLSDDPVAHSALIASAKEAPSEAFRTASEKALLERADRLGLARTAEQVKQWLRTLRVDDYPESYEPLLMVLDSSLPESEKFTLIRRAYSSNPLVALRVAATLAFDTGSLESFQPVLAQLIGDSLRLDDANNRAAISLIMAHQDLSLILGEDVLQNRDQVPDEDLSWLLKKLAVQRNIHVRAVANLALEREIVSPIQSLFLEIVRDRADLQESVVTALIRGAASSFSEDDFKSIGRWIDVQSEEVLLAAMVDVAEPKMARLAIEILGGKSLVLEPAASLMRWVKDNHWSEREKYSQLIGILGSLERADPKKVGESLKLLDSVVRDSNLLRILIESNNPQVVKTIVAKYGDLLGLGMLLTLLENPDREVRIDAIHALKDFNDLGALKIIVDRYEDEKDANVRAVYKETFWVIQRREDGQGQFGGS